MNLHTNIDFLHHDQINQNIDKWEVIKWTPALGKGKEDWIAAILFHFFCCIAMMDIRKETFNDIDVFPVWQTVIISVYVLMGWLCLTGRQVLRNIGLKPGASRIRGSEARERNMRCSVSWTGILPGIINCDFSFSLFGFFFVFPSFPPSSSLLPYILSSLI